MGILNFIQLLFLAALWGASFLFMRITVPILGPIWLIEIRVLLAGVALVPLLIYLNLWSEVRRRIIPLFIIGCINSAVPFLLFAFASLFLPAGFMSILNATSPLFGTAIATIWFKENLKMSQMLGFILGFAGVTVLVGIGWKTTMTTTTPWFFPAVTAALIASVMYAIGASYVKHQLSDVQPLTIATISQLSAAIFLLPFLPFTIPQTFPKPMILLAVVALALFSTAIAYLIYFRLIQNIGSAKALTVTYLIPIFAMLWGTIFLQEPISSSMVLGCGLILVGTAISNNVFSGKLAKN